MSRAGDRDGSAAGSSRHEHGDETSAAQAYCHAAQEKRISLQVTLQLRRPGVDPVDDLMVTAGIDQSR